MYFCLTCTLHRYALNSIYIAVPLQLTLRRQQVSEKLNEWTVFSEKYKELGEWLTNMESKVSQNGDISIEEMIEKLRKVKRNTTLISQTYLTFTVCAKEMQLVPASYHHIDMCLSSLFCSCLLKPWGALHPVMHLSFILFTSVASVKVTPSCYY